MRLLSPIDALRGALIDPTPRERNIVLALAVYAVVWTIYGAIAKSSQGLHPDMTELVAGCGCGSAYLRSRSGPIISWPC